MKTMSNGPQKPRSDACPLQVVVSLERRRRRPLLLQTSPPAGVAISFLSLSSRFHDSVWRSDIPTKRWPRRPTTIYKSMMFDLELR
jgi:hypothetical protein